MRDAKDAEESTVDGRTLCLFTTIVFTSFFVSLFSSLIGFGEALFATISLPVVYTIRYFYSTRQADAVGLMLAYVFGYLIFIATTQILGLNGMITYSIAFFVSILMRASIYTIFASLPENFDKNNPVFVIPVAIFLSAVFSGGLILWTA